MKVKLTAKYLLFAFSTLLAPSVFAENILEISVMDDAIVFADFNDKAPAVINYFTSTTEKMSFAFIR